MRYNLGLPPAPHWATISCVALSTSSSTVSRDQLYFVWDSSRVKSTGSDLLLTYKPYYNLICVLMRSNLGWSPAPHWATISCVALSSCSTAARDQLYFVWDSSKGKSTGSDYLLTYKRYYNLVCVLMRFNVEFGIIASTTLGHHIVCSAVHSLNGLFSLSTCTLFGIVGRRIKW
jgi:hypothetical protein